uniref:Uncharacterized protein n=1 Tax=Fagus sylvatica TaxID=28930 RepID=A0A2N9J4D9_FAGSY
MIKSLVGNAGVVVDWACEASVVVVAWACDLGVVVAWACRSRLGPATTKERPTALFSDLDPPRPATTKERPTAWLSSQICNHRGQPPPRREARTTLPCRSQRSGGGGAFRSPRWFLVAEICGGFWFRSPRQLVIFGAKQ